MIKVTITKKKPLRTSDFGAILSYEFTTEEKVMRNSEYGEFLKGLKFSEVHDIKQQAI